MLINEVEHIVGLSKKSIRYYEENGLLTPKRNLDNDYRMYDEADIQKLKVIKFLRELDVPIRELKLLNEEKMTLQECMEGRLDKIKQQEQNYQAIKKMCIEIQNSNDTFSNIDMTKHFEAMNILNKEGFTMRKTNTSKTKKILGAIVSSLLFGSFFLFLVGIISYFQFTETENIPIFIYLFLMVLFSIPLIGIIVNLISRIKEINGGEEDEASKY